MELNAPGVAIGLDYDRRSGYLFVCGGPTGAPTLSPRLIYLLLVENYLRISGGQPSRRLSSYYYYFICRLHRLAELNACMGSVLLRTYMSDTGRPGGFWWWPFLLGPHESSLRTRLLERTRKLDFGQFSFS